MITFPRPVSSVSSEWGVVPFVTQRKGEEAAPANLLLLPQRGGRLRLYYADEDVRDRPLRGMLWGRCSFSADADGMPTGEPQWKFLHPYRQMATMLAGRCQVCTRPARTALGWIFLAGPKDEDLTSSLIWTNQPPVCARHVRTVARLCPHMEENPMVVLAASAPLYGVLGSVYAQGPAGVEVVERPEEPVQFNDRLAPLTLASQLVRRMSAFRALDVATLYAELEAAA